MGWRDTIADAPKSSWRDTVKDLDSSTDSPAMQWLKDSGRATVDALPVIGGVVGGALGTPADVVTGPMGTVAGAGIGGYLGTAAKNLINHYIDPQKAPQSTESAILDPVVGGVHQAGYAAGSELAAAGLSKLASTVGDKVRDYVSESPKLQKIGNKIESTARTAARLTKPQAEAYVDNPTEVESMAKMVEGQSPELQQKAAEAIKNSRASLRAEGLKDAGNLTRLLSDKRVPLDASQLEGVSPEIDNMLSQARGQNLETAMMNPPVKPTAGADMEAFGKLAGTVPENTSVEMGANQANDIKRALQDMAKYKQGTVLDPVQQARQEQMGKLASRVRAAIENSGGSDVKALNQSMQERMLLQEELRKGLKKPLAYVGSESPDRLATLARTEKVGTGGLLDFGNKYSAAKTMAIKDVDDALSRKAQKEAGRYALRVMDALKNDPEVFGKFAGPLQKAAFFGATALATTHQVLLQTSPEYRNLINGLGIMPDQSPQVPPLASRSTAGRKGQ